MQTYRTFKACGCVNHCCYENTAWTAGWQAGIQSDFTRPDCETWPEGWSRFRRNQAQQHARGQMSPNDQEQKMSGNKKWQCWAHLQSPGEESIGGVEDLAQLAKSPFCLYIQGSWGLLTMMMYQSLTTVSSNSVTVYKWEKKKYRQLLYPSWPTSQWFLDKVFDKEDWHKTPKFQYRQQIWRQNADPHHCNYFRQRVLDSQNQEHGLISTSLKKSETDMTLSTRQHGDHWNLQELNISAHTLRIIMESNQHIQIILHQWV